MDILRNLFSKYTGFLRGLKLVYVVNNLLNLRGLKHNASLYKKFGVKKSVIASIGSHNFKEHDKDIPWLDQPGARKRLQEHPDFASFSPETRQNLLQFIDKGYFVLKGFYNAEEVARLNGEVDRLLKEHIADFNYTQRKIMDAQKVSEIIDQEYFRNPELIRLLNFIMGRQVIPFQTINFIKGSEQRAHSDSIHMTTEPLGYLIAAWTALEPTTPENGLLCYYPGSHRLPYITCQDYHSGNTRWQLGKNSYRNYEDHIEEVIKEYRLEPEYFLAEPGDILVWHANLLHGGSPIKDPSATRKSMVAHYYCEDVICYHEISQRPAILSQDADAGDMRHET